MKLSDLTGMSGFKPFFEKPAEKALALFSSILHRDGDEKNKISDHVIALMSAVLWADGKLEEADVEQFRAVLMRDYSFREIARFVTRLRERNKINLDVSAAALKALPAEERESIVAALIQLAMANNRYSEAEKAIVRRAAAGMEIAADKVGAFEMAVSGQQERRLRIIRSGAGIIVALVVITIFILTATFLKSVLFGLILAYIFLPLEQWYERKFSVSPFFLRLFAMIGAVFFPFRKLAEAIYGGKKAVLNPAEQEKIRRKALVNRAVTATVSSCILLALALGLILTAVSANYIAGFGSSFGREVHKALRETEALPEKTGAVKAPEHTKLSSLFTKIVNKLEDFKPKVRNLPLVKWSIEEVSKYLNDDKNQQELLGMVLKKSGGLFSFTAGFIANLCALLLNLLLTVFFFLLILKAMATFSHENKNSGLQSNYLVKTVFTSRWMPRMSEETLTEAKLILNEIFIKLKTWARGYLSIMLIESTLYISVFLIIGVPYAVPLGAIAGCTVLLPYIGPISSAVLTTLVCLATGHDISMLRIMAVLCTYLVITGILDQLFLYPTIIGESLGLSTLETIIVVLLGGLFAGLPGMLFAVPAASVLKYLIPKIYYCWES